MHRNFFRRGTRPRAAELTRFVIAHHDRFGVEAIWYPLTWAGNPVSAPAYYAAKRGTDEMRQVMMSPSVGLGR